MHIPSIFFDECSQGYLGRIMRLNGVKSPPVLRKLLTDMLPSATFESNENSLAHMFAKLLGSGLQSFVHNHTFMPFTRTVHGETAGIAHGMRSTRRQLIMAGTTLPIQQTRLCKECIQEDLTIEGVARWRRSHQLPGVVLCQKHGSGLLLLKTNAMLQGLPTDFEQNAIAIDQRILNEARQNPTIQRYANICCAFLESKHPVPPWQAAARLSARARLKGLRISAIGNIPNLSDLAITQLGGHWLDEYFDCLKNKQAGAFVGKIDGPWISKHESYNASSYALAIAILWDSSDNALTDFFDSSPTSIQGKDSSVRIAAAHLHRPGISISKHLPMPSVGDSGYEIGLAIQSFVSGLSLSEACEKHDVNLTDVEASLRTITARQLIRGHARRKT